MRRALIPALVSVALFTVVGLTAASAASRPPDGPLFAVLLGENEIPAGDPDGRGAANVIIHQGEQLCFGLSVTGIGDPTAAHIHRGGKHEVGGVVVPLTPPSTGDPGASAACVPIGADLAAEILDKPHDFYVNVHNAAFPGGALRGQLFRDTH